eukprot:gene12287-biopygen1768
MGNRKIGKSGNRGNPLGPLGRTGRTGRISRNSLRWFRVHLPAAARAAAAGPDPPPPLLAAGADFLRDALRMRESRSPPGRGQPIQGNPAGSVPALFPSSCGGTRPCSVTAPFAAFRSPDSSSLYCSLFGALRVRGGLRGSGSGRPRAFRHRAGGRVPCRQSLRCRATSRAEEDVPPSVQDHSNAEVVEVCVGIHGNRRLQQQPSPSHGSLDIMGSPTMRICCCLWTLSRRCGGAGPTVVWSSRRTSRRRGATPPTATNFLGPIPIRPYQDATGIREEVPWIQVGGIFHFHLQFQVGLVRPIGDVPRRFQHISQSNSGAGGRDEGAVSCRQLVNVLKISSDPRHADGSALRICPGAPDLRKFLPI